MENKFLKTLLIICALTFVSCSAQKNKSNASLSFKKIESQSHGGFQQQQFLVITNSKQLKKIYTQLNLTRKPGLPLPKIDFDNETVIALFMGQKNTGGFSVEIDSVINTGDSFVDIIIKENAPTGMASMAITHPFSLYKLNTSNSKINFIGYN